jgi:exo-beta-1,3-glucanase (GH17 family)
MSDSTTPGSSRRPLDVTHGNAICYSGYREGQSPRDGAYPTRNQVHEDLQILARNWDYLRLYDSSRHAEIVLDVVEGEGLDFKVMLGIDLGAELSNPNCPWGADFHDETLETNRRLNDEQVDKAIELANRYRDIVFSVAVGNEAAVEWTDHLVSVERLIDHARRIRDAVEQPVTSCDNYVPWIEKLDPLAAELDFVSLHTYPVWEYKGVQESLDHTKDNFHAVAARHPDTPVVITEAGWTTASNGRGIKPENASEEIQAAYYDALLDWTSDEGILTFVFEAFDEPWKGSAHPLEPEKHWGLFRLDRTPKLVMQNLYADLVG